MNPEAAASSPLVHVVAGVLRDQRGAVLLGQRLPGKHLAGSWEFPGGKWEAGETREQALRRELNEELGVTADTLRPWLSLTHTYPELSVRLWLYMVDSWRGEPEGREGQALQWVMPEAMHKLPMPAADRPIVGALMLDPRYLITPDPADVGGREAVLDWTRRALGAGRRLFQLRARSLAAAELALLAADFNQLLRPFEARWLIDTTAEQARTLGADGVHLSPEQLMQLEARPLPERLLVAASCRNAAQLAHAGGIAADFVTISPLVAAGQSSDAEALGWNGFAQLAGFSPLPVYARGGVGPDDLARSREHGGFGVAGSRRFRGAE